MAGVTAATEPRAPPSARYMKAFGEAWPGLAGADQAESPIVQQAAAELPWFHHCYLLDRTQPGAECEFYVLEAAEHGTRCRPTRRMAT